MIQFLKSLFGGARRPAGGEASETDGSEITFPLAHVAIQPARGWLIFRANLTQKETDTQICEPTLMGRFGSITTLLFPGDGLAPAQQADAFIARSTGTLVERKELHSRSGIPLVCVTLKEKLKNHDLDALSVCCFFSNPKGRVAMICFAGEPATALRTGEMIVQTIRFPSA